MLAPTGHFCEAALLADVVDAADAMDRVRARFRPLGVVCAPPSVAREAAKDLLAGSPSPVVADVPEGLASSSSSSLEWALMSMVSSSSSPSLRASRSESISKHRYMGSKLELLNLAPLPTSLIFFHS